MRLQRPGRIPNEQREDLLRALLRQLENPLLDKPPIRHELASACTDYADFYEPHSWTEEQYASVAVRLRDGARLSTTVNFADGSSEEVQLLQLGNYTIFIKDSAGDEGIVQLEQVNPNAIREA